MLASCQSTSFGPLSALSQDSAPEKRWLSISEESGEATRMFEMETERPSCCCALVYVARSPRARTDGRLSLRPRNLQPSMTLEACKRALMRMKEIRLAPEE